MADALLQGLAAVAGPGTRLLVLGSFPGAASLKAQQYYGHPQNHFWRILQSLWPQHPLPPAGPVGYTDRCTWLLDRGLGLWDVYQSCEREGRWFVGGSRMAELRMRRGVWLGSALSGRQRERCFPRRSGCVAPRYCSRRAV